MPPIAISSQEERALGLKVACAQPPPAHTLSRHVVTTKYSLNKKKRQENIAIMEDNVLDVEMVVRMEVRTHAKGAGIASASLINGSLLIKEYDS